MAPDISECRGLLEGAKRPLVQALLRETLDTLEKAKEQVRGRTAPTTKSNNIAQHDTTFMVPMSEPSG